MTRGHINIATLYSSAQCVLSVVGSVGVILLFAGIPQLIYSPTVSASNLLTFVMGAVLIMTMVAGNSILNYKYRAMERARREGDGQEENGNGSGVNTGSADDKPPSYESIITLDGLPPEYSSIVAQKPPRYEEIVREMCAASDSREDAATLNTCGSPEETQPEPNMEESHDQGQRRIVITLSKAREEQQVLQEGAPGERTEGQTQLEEPQETETCASSQQEVQVSSYSIKTNVVAEEGLDQQASDESET